MSQLTGDHGSQCKLMLSYSDEQERLSIHKSIEDENSQVRVVDESACSPAFWRAEAVLRVVEWTTEVERRCADIGYIGRSPVLLVVPEGNISESINSPCVVDIIQRPFTLQELRWRIQRALKRVAYQQATAERDEPPSLDMCSVTGQVLVHGRPLKLRQMECKVLVYLIKNSERWVRTQDLQREVLGSNGGGGAARTQIYEVRRKLKQAGCNASISYVPGLGYQIMSVSSRQSKGRQ